MAEIDEIDLIDEIDEMTFFDITQHFFFRTNAFSVAYLKITDSSLCSRLISSI